MDPKTPLVVAALAGAFLGFWLLVALSRGAKGVSAWANLATRLGGRLFEKGGDHVVRFAWGETEAAVHESGGLRFEILRPGFAPPILQLSGAPPEGSSASPSRQVVAGCKVTKETPDGLAFAQGAASDVLRLLREQAVSSKFKVMLEGGIRIETGRTGMSSEDMLAYVRHCVRLADLVREFAEGSSHVKVVGEGAVSSSECQVCGMALEKEVVRCASCRTAHHEDCWSYTGRCSTFGCGQARFVRD